MQKDDRVPRTRRHQPLGSYGTPRCATRTSFGGLNGRSDVTWRVSSARFSSVTRALGFGVTSARERPYVVRTMPHLPVSNAFHRTVVVSAAALVALVGTAACGDGSD